MDWKLLSLLLLLSVVEARKRHRRQNDQQVSIISQLDITKLHIRSDVQLRFATTYVTSHVINSGQSAAEAVFDLRLPKTAFITNFTMEVEGRNYTGSVKEKAKANQEYQRAVSRGQSAAQVRKSPRGTDRFSVSVNVAAAGDVTFYLVYQQLLKRRHGLYSNVIYVDPGQVVADLRIDVHINETREITDLYVPPITKNDTESSLMTLETIPDAQISFVTESEVQVTYQPSVTSQRSASDKGTSGKFVVLYDVLRNFDGGEVAVEDGYFVHYFAPSGLPIINKNVLFVLDTSGSMYGTKMRQVKDAMTSILSQLREGDFFNILRFSSDVSRWFTEAAMLSASSDNKQNALNYVENLSATGGTNVNDAVLGAIDLLSEHMYMHESELSSMVIFLTDGDPTVGVTNVKQILDNVRRRNEGRFPLYSLGFGHTVNFKFLKRLSLQNSGFARKIYEDADAGLQLEGFFKEVATPLLNDVTFDYVGGVNDSSLTKRVFPTFYNGSEIVVCGALTRGQDVTEMRSVIYARSKEDAVNIDLPIMLPRPPFPFPHPVPEPRPFQPGRIERLWAYLTIQQYLEYMMATTNNTEKESYKQKALDLSLKYQFVTDLTSMVVVKPDQSEELPETRDRPDRREGGGQLLSTNTRVYTAPRGMVGPSGGAGPLPAVPMNSVRRKHHQGISSGSISYDLSSPSGHGLPPIPQTGSDPLAGRMRPPSRNGRGRQGSGGGGGAQSPKRKQFGYSFADGDPHFLVTIPGSPQNKPLCFNIRGETNATYLLLNDTVHDVLVTGKVIEGEPTSSSPTAAARRRNKRRTYFGRITLKFGQVTLKITPRKVVPRPGQQMNWSTYNTSLANAGESAVFMPSRNALKVRLPVGAVLVVVRHVPRNMSARHNTSHLGFYVENIGLLSGAAEGLTGDFAHSRIDDMSRPGSTLIRFKPQGSGTGRMVRVREIFRRNLATKQRLPCLFVDRNGREVLQKPLSEYKIRRQRILSATN